MYIGYLWDLLGRCETKTFPEAHNKFVKNNVKYNVSLRMYIVWLRLHLLNEAREQNTTYHLWNRTLVYNMMYLKIIIL